MTNNIPKQAMVLAAGFGKRMRPFTDTIPKPMVEVAGITLIDHAINHLESAGITKIVVNTHYKAGIVEEHLAKRNTPSISFSREEELLDTGGGIAKALGPFEGNPFFSVNSDVIWFDENISALESLFTIWNDDIDVALLLHPVTKAIGYEGEGDFFADGYGHIRRRKAGEIAPYIYTGIQLLHPRLFLGCPNGPFSINLLYDQAINSKPPRIKAVIHDGALLNVGDPVGKELAEKYMQNR